MVPAFSGCRRDDRTVPRILWRHPMTRTRLVRSWLVLPLLAALLVIAGDATAQKRGGTLIMLVQPEPPTLAAYQSTSGPIGQVMSKVYEGLLEYDFNLK